MASSTGVMRLLPMFTPMTGRLRLRRRATRRVRATSAPALLNPMRLMTARSGMSRNRRGVSLPGCACAVMVPTSMWPKPRRPRPITACAFLSKPAATPNGVGNVRPSARTGCGFGERVKRATRGPMTGQPSMRMTTKPRWWARSGSMRAKKVRKMKSYTSGYSCGRAGNRPCSSRSCSMADSKSSSDSKAWYTLAKRR